MNIGLGYGVNAKGGNRVEVPFLNVQGATITLGLPICFTNLAASLDGAGAVLPVAGVQRTFGGIALKNTPNNGVGVAIARGLCNSVAIFALGTSATVALDETLGVGVAGSLGVNSTGLTARTGFVVALEAVGAAINSPGGYIKGFVRAL